MQFKNRLSFLNVLVDNSGPNLVTNTFRKFTHTELCIKWNSFVLHRFEMNLINCLLDRCYRICSSYKIICDEFDQIKTMLSRNGYPKHVLDKCILDFFNRKFTTKPSLSKKKRIPLQKDFYLFAILGALLL